MTAQVKHARDLAAVVDILTANVLLFHQGAAAGVLTHAIAGELIVVLGLRQARYPTAVLNPGIRANARSTSGEKCGCVRHISRIFVIASR